MFKWLAIGFLLQIGFQIGVIVFSLFWDYSLGAVRAHCRTAWRALDIENRETREKAIGTIFKSKTVSLHAVNARITEILIEQMKGTKQ